MSVTTTPHLNFRGDARQALTFYQHVFGGNLVVVTCADAHAVQDLAEAGQVMWGQVTAPSGFSVMAYDAPSRLPWSPGEIPFFVSVRGADAEEITRCWEGLKEGASIVQPLGPASWAPLYGMLKDRFGVTWVLEVAR